MGRWPYAHYVRSFDPASGRMTRRMDPTTASASALTCSCVTATRLACVTERRNAAFIACRIASSIQARAAIRTVPRGNACRQVRRGSVFEICAALLTGRVVVMWDSRAILPRKFARSPECCRPRSKSGARWHDASPLALNLSARWSPSCRFRIILCAEPSFARFGHIDVGVVELAGSKVNSLALAIHVALDDAVG
jgi:hypothetical protein